MLYPVQNDKRNTLDLSGIWDFQIDPQGVGEQQGWINGLQKPRPMAVPGSWNEQYEDLFNYFSLAWYVKRTYVPQSWQGQRIFLRVGSACYFATVYINGVKVGSHEGGHLPFAFEITPHIRWGEENLIAISVENELKPTRVPAANMPLTGGSSGYPRTTFDFFPFAGLHRPVVLYSLPQTYIEDITVVTEIEGADGIVSVRVKLNEAVGTQGKIQLKGEEQTISSPLVFEHGKAEAHQRVSQARFWSDEHPDLYQLNITTPDDHYSMDIGIRTIAVQGKQVLLNGKPVQMNGFGRHEDFFASGKGLNYPLLVKDYQLLRWIGANSYRTSHYPYSEEEMQLADREGFLIIDEIPAVSLPFDTPENMDERMRMCLQQIEELVARDKNHPSVVMWSVANEPSLGFHRQGSAVEIPGKAFLDRLIQRARALDATRLVSFVILTGSPVSWMETCDVVCMNRYYGWYDLGGQLDSALERLEAELDAVWEQWHKPILMTEFGTDTVAGLHGHPDVMWAEEYQADFIRRHLELAAKKDYIVGMQVWNFADFAAVQSTFRVGGMNLKGVFTRARAPKMAAHVLREFWAKNKKAA
jgi:beta-glucuronidase